MTAVAYGGVIKLGGKATVVCVHDREKREVVTEEQVARLGLECGVVYKPGLHRLFNCTCCDNLFVGDGTSERYCSSCIAPPVHALGGPLAEPGGAVA